MDVVSLAPVPVASLRWRRGTEPWAQAVLCKLTLRLEPGAAELAKRHEPIYEHDRHGDDAAEARMYAPSDLAPLRRLVDVTLVGDAYAPRGHDGGPIAVRVRVGSLDKTVRIAAPDGGFGGDRSVPLCDLGPLAAGSPARRSLLGAHADPSPHQEGGSYELPADLDLAFFSAAPPDQRLLELMPGAEIVLSNLHPTQPELRTRLPKLEPQTFVERRGKRRSEVPMAIDALWIDTTRGVCTVTWRTQIDLEGPDEPGKIWVTVAGPGKRLNAHSLARFIRSLGGEDPAIDDDPTADEGRDPLATTISMRAKHGPLPKLSGSSDYDDELDAPDSEQTKTTVLERPRHLLAGDGRRTASLEEELENTADGPPDDGDAAPVWLKNRTPEQTGPLPNAPPARRPPARAPMATHPGLGPAEPPPAPSRAFPPVPQPPASLAAAPAPQPPAPLPSAPLAAVRKPTGRREIVQLLWYEPDASERLRRSFAKLCDELEFAPLDPRHDLPSADPKESREHHLHFGVLEGAPSADAAGLLEALRAAVGDGARFTPPLVAMSGTLRFPFAELAILHGTAAALTPLATDDKKLKAALDQVREICDTPLLTGSAESVTGVTEHLRKLYASSRRAVPLERLDEMVERILLEERRYQKRRLFGGGWIRALFAPAGSKEELPAYLPEALGDRLPLMLRFEVRLLAEAHVRQDQYEKHPHALKIVTLGRVLDARALEAGRGAA